MSTGADILTIEIGSTLTKVNAFYGARLVGKAVSLTTPAQVMEGFEQAMSRLESACGISLADVSEVFALSSAAGGLRMTVHGLTREMTTRAAEEASLGAGANLKLITAGKISNRILDRIIQINPNLMLLAGGVEYGEEETVLENARIISQSQLKIPVIYAGNVTLQDEIRELFKSCDCELYVVENVYPRFDVLNIGPVRDVIQDIFSHRLTIAPGIDELKKLTGGNIMPVPAACLKAAETLAETLGELAVVDVGGATTDVYSIIRNPTTGNLDVQIPSRRTVEGDLGLFVSAESMLKAIGGQNHLKHLRALPEKAVEVALSRRLALKAVEKSLVRHAGRMMHGAYLSGGGVLIKGQDLRNVNVIIGTGGGLAKLEGGLETIREAIRSRNMDSLLPGTDVRICLDRDYIFSACGSFATRYPQRAISIMMNSIGK